MARSWDAGKRRGRRETAGELRKTKLDARRKEGPVTGNKKTQLWLGGSGDVYRHDGQEWERSQ